MSAFEGIVNPAADKRRMYVALGSLVVLGMLAWFTIDSSAVVHVHGFSNMYIGFEDRDVEVRWLPILILGLFALRVVLAHRRAQTEKNDLQ